MGGSAYRIVFGCSGHICRSPTAEVVLRAMLRDAGLDDEVEVSSAGLGAWHVGDGADERSVAAMARRGYDGSAHAAQQFRVSWFADHDLIVAMDRGHLRDLRRIAAPGEADKLRLFTSYDPDAADHDVPDPYYGGADGFDRVLDVVERGCRGLLEEVRRE